MVGAWCVVQEAVDSALEAERCGTAVVAAANDAEVAVAQGNEQRARELVALAQERAQEARALAKKACGLRNEWNGMACTWMFRRWDRSCGRSACVCACWLLLLHGCALG